MFADRGYDNTRVEDIAAAALYATGTFYTHFASKDDVFDEVVRHLGDEPPAPGPRASLTDPDCTPDPAQEIHLAVTRYFHAHARDERRWAVLEQGSIRGAAHGRPPLARSRTYRDAWLRPLTAWQQDGIVAADVPLPVTVHALVAMTEWLNALERVYRYAFPQPVPISDVSRVWCVALGLRPASRRPNRRRFDTDADSAAPRPEDGRLAIDPAAGLGPKAARTRAGLIAASRRLFAKSRPGDVGIRDIAAEAGVSVGTFYRYFGSKEDVLEEVLASVQRELLAPAADHSDSPAGGVRAANRAWFRQVQRHTGLWRTLAEAAITTPSITTIWARRRDAYTLRLQSAFGRWQAAGLIDCPLGPGLSAIALSAMTERLAQVWFVLGDGPPPMSAAVSGVTDIWLRVLGLDAD